MVPVHSGKLRELEARDFLILGANESFEDRLSRKSNEARSSRKSPIA